ncbi:hypothetical protein OIO90_003258 [Microbotryomycetes sp. JL221]|nr:hypothetical protein OIO90_003258 [Microbotryomycetes sp. JL221]
MASSGASSGTFLNLPARTEPQQIQVPQDLDSVRSKLVQLIDQLSTVLSQLQYLQLTTPDPSTTQPGLLSYHDLLNRFNLMLSHVVTLGSLLSSRDQLQQQYSANVAPQQQLKPQDRGRDPRKEKWQASVVVPSVAIDEQKDWLVGMLLRTKQAPHVEEHLDNLVKNLPRPFNDPAAYQQAYNDHSTLTRAASDRIQALKKGTRDEDWDWKGRVEIDQDEQDEDENDENDESDKTKSGNTADVEMTMATDAAPPERKWTLQEMATYCRTGKLPS